MVHPPRHEDDEHAVAPRNRLLDDLSVVCRSAVEFDPIGELVELRDALLAADADHLVSAIEGVSHHVAPELSGGADNANAVGMTHGGNDRSSSSIRESPI